MHLFTIVLVLLAQCFIFSSASAENLEEIVSKMHIVPMEYGANKLNAAGTDMLVMRGLFQTETTSTRDIYTVMAHENDAWQWARLEDAVDKSGSIVVETWPHASEDSLVSVRFMKDAKDFYLLTINRELKTGYAASPVTFTLYRLTRNKDFGFITFHKISALSSKEEYCNADWAAHQELNLPLRREYNEYPCGNVAGSKAP